MKEWRLAFCIMFCAFFTRKMLQDDSWRILDILRKMRKMVKKSHLKKQKPDLGETFSWTSEAETKTVDSSRYFLKHFLSVFLDVLENLLELNCKG